MSEQLDYVYNWMIKYGKKFDKKRCQVRDDIVYNSSRIAEIHAQLAKTKGANTKFCNHMIKNGLFKDVKSAQQALRLYSTNTGTCMTDIKRTMMVELYDHWVDGKVKTFNMEKHNSKLQQYWSTHDRLADSNRIHNAAQLPDDND